MARPRKFYVIFEDGWAVYVAEGLAEANQQRPMRTHTAYPTREQAEEFAAWWNHDRDLVTHVQRH